MNKLNLLWVEILAYHVKQLFIMCGGAEPNGHSCCIKQLGLLSAGRLTATDC